jgi:pilus assembly protein CpaF
MPGIVGTTRDELVSAVADEVLGFGPLEPLLRDAAISEVMVNAPDTVFYEKEGRLYLSSVRFRDDQHIMRIVERIVAPLGRRVDECRRWWTRACRTDRASTSSSRRSRRKARP